LAVVGLEDGVDFVEDFVGVLGSRVADEVYACLAECYGGGVDLFIVNGSACNIIVVGRDTYCSEEETYVAAGDFV
jgi:hypothetical protein